MTTGTANEVVSMYDVDDTPLDNDRVTADRHEYPESLARTEADGP